MKKILQNGFYHTEFSLRRATPPQQQWCAADVRCSEQFDSTNVCHEAQVHGMIGAVWEAMTTRQLAIAGGATCAYFGYIFGSYRGDMQAAKVVADDDSKVPTILKRPSVDQAMSAQLEKAKLQRRQSGSMAIFTEGGSALGGAESGSAA